jgi:Virulence factor
MGELTVIRWRDIPMQVVGRASDGASAKVLLSDRFQEAVDAAAMVAGLIGSDDYTAEMVIDRRQVADDALEAEVDAEAAKLEGAWTDDVLRGAIRSGGMRDSS